MAPRMITDQTLGLEKNKTVFRLSYFFGGELGIRTLGSFWEHSISSAAPSTTRTTLRTYHQIIILIFS